MSALSLDDMHLFARLYELGKLSAVARERLVPVSQVSRALQRIEGHYRARLVHRSTHGLSFTPEGEVFARRCARILEELDLLDAELGQSREEVSGLVRVSASSVTAEHILVPSLPSLLAGHPKLRIDLRVNDAFVDIAREGIDIAIRTGDPSQDNWAIRPLGHLRRRFYASPSYLARHGEPQNPQDLLEHDLIHNSQHPMLNQWRFQAPPAKKRSSRSVHKHGHTPPDSPDDTTLVVAQGRLSSDNTATLMNMALNDLGIARIISLAAEPWVAQGRLQAVLGTWVVNNDMLINAVMLPGRHRLPKIKACTDHWAAWMQRLL